jgi:hypothetical protein
MRFQRFEAKADSATYLFLVNHPRLWMDETGLPPDDLRP